ncbi:MAG: beta-ribofuranosylaminobenzene 5'-phosphate synthase [Candidatus Symbiobacter sp.]|nr:beta-ribofuranosylaminobenzene 5'-phosphate synthase [Candidatus Symbiobacter sp.]
MLASRHIHSIHITASARLHFGFLDLQGGLGRRFGSIGVAIDGIFSSFSLSLSDDFAVTGAGADDFAVTGAAATTEAPRIRAHLQRLSRDNGFPPVAVQIDAVIPPHAGLGSGTQLAMGLAEAYAKLVGRDLPLATLAERGARSGIGLAVYQTGGLVVDGGQKIFFRKGDAEPSLVHPAPPVLARFDFPRDWRFVLMLDTSRQGIHNEAERAAFAALPPMDAAISGELCRRVVMQLLPGLAEQDFAAVSDALGAVQRLNGDYFAAAQGGRFAHPVIGRVLAHLAAGGVVGVGQSSWGPTGFALAESEAAAMGLAAHIQDLCRGFSGSSPVSTRIVQARNIGREMGLC